MGKGRGRERGADQETDPNIAGALESWDKRESRV